MLIETLPVGNLEANCYIIGCPETDQAAIVDPGDEARRILAQVAKLGLTVSAIILTHGHYDHIGAVAELKKATGAPVMIHRQDSEMLTKPALNLSAWLGEDIELKPADRLLEDGDLIKVGNLTLEVLHTPGHTPGGICLKVGGDVFTGDTLFAQSVGRSDFPGGSHTTLINSIKQKLLVLPDDTMIYPGHGPASTIGQEKRLNPYLQN
ncbi:beta-lactamase domain protein [Desulfotomaculum nigrificans CO-1-SRB]|uniref:Beta-lactamase domain protein n=1 Tax=Desulfotomaculum nigrificans (strain DSM 14880 / VKM B-2319 / CO-1-SRB) TaxID=868595 RepID=F6B2Z2_DESCC|nr:MBL fold metallo-hydrolase [Desulfotomaculum nigrificans]AEF95100.1 beta-lactamase domain protein [Desulfotomaculum nigrificans CO-1-SRB]